VSFEKKKIQGETLSEYLLAIRQGLGLSVEAAAEQAGVRLQFLQALEAGEFNVLPPDVYVFGFLRQLAELYFVDPLALVDQYKKEKAIANQIQRSAAVRGNWAGRYFNRLVITPKILSISAGALIVAATLLYIVWQVLSINKTPSLEVFQPHDRQAIKDSFVDVRGKTDPGVGVTVNGQDVFVDSGGNFSTQLSLKPGPEEIDIVADNKLGKSAAVKMSVTGQADLPGSSSQVSLKLEFSADGNLTYAVDDNSPQQTLFFAGDVKTLIGQNKIVISTSNAGATVATLNGQRLGPLGRRGEQLSNIPFSAENTASSTAP